MLLDDPGDLRRDRHERRRVLALEQGEVVELEESLQLLDGTRVIVDAQVDPTVVPFEIAPFGADHDERRGLHPAAVPAFPLAGGEGREEPLGKIPRGRRERSRHPPNDLRSVQDVPLARETRPDLVPRPRWATLPRERGRPPSGVDDPELPLLAVRVCGRQRSDDLLRGSASLEEP